MVTTAGATGELEGFTYRQWLGSFSNAEVPSRSAQIRAWGFERGLAIKSFVVGICRKFAWIYHADIVSPMELGHFYYEDYIQIRFISLRVQRRVLI